MNWITSILHGILKAILEKYGDMVGKTVAKDAVRDDHLMRRTGIRLRKWLQSSNSSKRG